jgi:hypothetical protein
MTKGKNTFITPWLFVYLAVGLGATILTWTVIRPYLVITDGVPTATDPLTPFGVCLVNLVFVAVAWAVVGIVHLLWTVGRRLL